jgi:hypothetical protein
VFALFVAPPEVLRGRRREPPCRDDDDEGGAEEEGDEETRAGALVPLSPPPLLCTTPTRRCQRRWALVAAMSCDARVGEVGEEERCGAWEDAVESSIVERRRGGVFPWRSARHCSCKRPRERRDFKPPRPPVMVAVVIPVVVVVVVPVCLEEDEAIEEEAGAVVTETGWDRGRGAGL